MTGYDIFDEMGLDSLKEKIDEKVPMEVNVDNGTGKRVVCKITETYKKDKLLIGRTDIGTEIVLGLAE